MRHDAFGAHNKDAVQGYPVPAAAFWKLWVCHAIGFDDFRLFIGKKGEANVPACGKIGMDRHAIVCHDCDVVTESLEFFEMLVPDDRLGFTAWSPTQ
jgi:hypothetical protein